MTERFSLHFSAQRVLSVLDIRRRLIMIYFNPTNNVNFTISFNLRYIRVLRQRSCAKTRYVMVVN